ncbi:hypothetical protein C0Q70_11189 [Pomacea canaliculata]|uniref:Uncharacterized protein n=1 Tax=Pomacea canaliculata TaxID=400727 RepID=A0A2T7P5B6_POMCA|nr:hypothetical protein C0Q70_11189 [Pomacea canaliculata]
MDRLTKQHEAMHRQETRSEQTLTSHSDQHQTRSSGQRPAPPAGVIPPNDDAATVQKTMESLRQMVTWFYPDLDKRAYFLPPVYFNRECFKQTSVGGLSVLVTETPPDSVSRRRQPPPTSGQSTAKPSLQPGVAASSGPVAAAEQGRCSKSSLSTQTVTCAKM